MKRSSKKNNSSRLLNIALTQMPCSPDADANLARQLNLIERAAKGGANIICTQELFRSQYFCQVEDHRFFDLAEPIPGETTEALSAVARETRMAVIGSVFGAPRDGGCGDRLDVRAPGGGDLPQHGGDVRRRRLDPGPLPQDAHPRRPAL